MNKKAIYVRVLAFTVFFFTTLLSATAQIQLHQHLVKDGETLYRLSIKYGVTVSQILRYNPGLNSSYLKAGNTVLVPIEKARESEEKYFTEHKVRRKETLYSISKKYDITIDDLKKANPEMFEPGFELKRGITIKIPLTSSTTKSEKTKEVKNVDFSKKSEKSEKTKSAYYRRNFDEAQQIPEKKKVEAPTPKPIPKPSPKPTPQKEIKPITKKQNVKEPIRHNGYSPVKIAIILPFADAAGSNRCIEYYRGFLLALEKLKEEGKDVEIYAFNEPHANSSIIMELESIRLKRVHLIVGPLYFDHFDAVSTFCNTNKIKTLIPFSSKANVVKYNPYIYLLNAPEEEKNELASNLFVKNFSKFKAVFVVSDSRNERSFTQHLRGRLHQSGIEVGDIALVSSDEQILAACHSQKPTIFIPDGSTNTDFENVMTRMLTFKNNHPGVPTALFAYPEWQKFATTRRSDMHSVDTYIFTNAFYNPWSPTTNELKHKYESWFNSDIIETTPHMFMLGYDSGLTFINGLHDYGKNFNTQDMKLPLQQSDIVFKKINENGGYINGSMWFIHYRKDYQIEKLSEK